MLTTRRRKVFWSCGVLLHPLQRGSRTDAPQTKRRFSAGKIRGALQLCDSSEWALPHLAPRRFTPPPTPPAPPSLCFVHGNANSPLVDGIALTVHPARLLSFSERLRISPCKNGSSALEKKSPNLCNSFKYILNILCVLADQFLWSLHTL